MDSSVLCMILLYVLLYLSNVQTQELQEQDALCNENSCLLIYFQRKTFLDAWRSCRSQGGNLITIRSPDEERIIETLFSKLELTESRPVFVWIGLQRQPRRCVSGHPMRGFSWITGEPSTQYTNWQQKEFPNSCLTPSCVGIGYSTSTQKSQDNFKWEERPCSNPVDGYLCRYTFSRTCQTLSSEGYGNALYTTPFDLVTSLLTHVPLGSVATVPCLSKSDQTVLCAQGDDETVGWNRDPPFCSDISKTSWCDEDNGGCHHYCIKDDNAYFCDCKEGFLLAEDGMSCFQTDPCQGSLCQYECLTVMDSYRCACPEGYMLAQDDHGCLDVDECSQSPCEQICVNVPGSFECRCREGYEINEEGMCKDVDECVKSPCEHDCENIIGSYICHCHHGFAPQVEDPSSCEDVDECQFEGTCEQMCVNFLGGFQCYCEEGYDIQTDLYSCRLSDEQQYFTEPTSILLLTDHPNHMAENQEPDYYKPHENESLDWLSELTNTEMAPTDLLWLTSASQNVTESTLPTESPTINMEIDHVDQHGFGADIFVSSTTSTPRTEYYGEERTTEFTIPPTTTVAGDAWKGMGLSSSPNELDKQGTTQSSFNTDTKYKTVEHELRDAMSDDESTTSYTELQTLTQTLISPQGSNDDSSSEETQGNSWLLVGLLVPLCIIFVLMVALGIIYCTQCTSKPQKKNATECYHWISGDKAAVDIGSGGVSKV